MSSPRPLRLGIIGCGRATNTLHLPALRRVRGIEVVAVADARPEALDTTAATHGIAKRYGDYRALLDDPDIEAVGVCVPAMAHDEVGLAALAAGKHVLVEKPLALDLATCDRWVEAAAKSDTHVLVGYNLRHHRYVREMRARLQQGEVGGVEAVRSTWTSAVRNHPTPAWRDRRASGGGALFEIATHHVDLWRFLLGQEVETVYASGRSVDTEDESVSLTATLTDGVVVSALFSERTAIENTLAVYGREARMSVDPLGMEGPRVNRTTQPPHKLSARVRRLASSVRAFPRGIVMSRLGGEFCLSYDRQWRHFAAVVAGDEAPAVTVEDGRRAVQVVLAAMESLDTGAPVSVASVSG